MERDSPPKWLRERFAEEQSGKTYPVAGAGVRFYEGADGQVYRVVRETAYSAPIYERWTGRPVPR